MTRDWQPLKLSPFSRHRVLANSALPSKLWRRIRIFQDLFAKRTVSGYFGQSCGFCSKSSNMQSRRRRSECKLVFIFHEFPQISYFLNFVLLFIMNFPQIFQLMDVVFIFFSKIPRISTLMNCLAFIPNSMHIQLQYSKHKKPNYIEQNKHIRWAHNFCSLCFRSARL